MFSTLPNFTQIRPSIHHHKHLQHRSSIRCASTPPTAAPSSRLMQFISENGAPEQAVTLQSVTREGQEVDITVASKPLQPGDIALRIPEKLIVTLDQIFQEDAAIAELLTTSKLSELACLTLYLSYEKKRGKDSFWYPFIKELDRQGGRGVQGAKSPLLWQPHEIEDYLQGSPVVEQIKERLRGIEREYSELDTVWYLAGSLFRNYPFEIPTEQFTLDVFTQAFAAIQAAVVHLQGVPMSKRFALVPLGPPLLSYSSTAKAMLQYNADEKEVQLVCDRGYQPGDAVVAWCGPQPNSRLLINYGIVDEMNPFDKLPLSIMLPSEDPLYRQKRGRLSEHQLSTQQTFQLTPKQPLPPQLIPYLRLAYATTEQELWAVDFDTTTAKPISDSNEKKVLSQLIGVLKRRLSGYKGSIDEDDAIIKDPLSGPRKTVAARLLKLEKILLNRALSEVMAYPGASEVNDGVYSSSDVDGVKFT